VTTEGVEVTAEGVEVTVKCVEVTAMCVEVTAFTRHDGLLSFKIVSQLSPLCSTRCDVETPPIHLAFLYFF